MTHVMVSGYVIKVCYIFGCRWSFLSQ